MMMAGGKASSSLDETLTPIDLNEIVETVLGDLGATIEETKAKIVVGPLPSLAVEPAVHASSSCFRI